MFGSFDRFVALPAAWIILVLAAGSSSQAPATSENQAEAILRGRCVTCHEMDLIEQQRLGRAGWERELDKMIRWGAILNAEEKKTLLDYLSRNSGARPEILPRFDDAASARGAALFKDRCLTCHETDLTDQQRLNRAGWMREVDKMIGWGAVVSEAEKATLVDYLTKRGQTTFSPISISLKQANLALRNW